MAYHPHAARSINVECTKSVHWMGRCPAPQRNEEAIAGGKEISSLPIDEVHVST